MKRIIPCILAAVILLLPARLTANPDTDNLRKQFVDELLRRPVDVEHVHNLVSSLNPDGTWPGIDYVDTARTAFQHIRHLANMVSLSMAYAKKGNKLYHDKKVLKALSASLDYWLEHDFLCENWWNNEIGTPTQMAAIMLLMDSKLTPAQKEKMLKIAGRANINAPGARQSGDRIRIAGIQAQVALFKREDAEVESLIKLIEDQLQFVPVDQKGLQYDYSFHHRTDWVNNTLSYGVSYSETFIDWAYKVRNTRYRFSEETLRRMIDFFLDGQCKQMVYARIADPAVNNRDITRKGYGRVWGTAMPEKLMAASSYRQAEMEEVIQARKGGQATPVSYARFFWNSDHFSFQRPGFFTSVRMYSTRRASMEEPYNGEGLMNHFRADGTNYLSLTGTEYSDITPCFDWMRIPGATTVLLDRMPPEEDVQRWGLNDFAGAVTDGMYGAVGLEFMSPVTSLRAKKAWFFFDKEYVCLGADITNPNHLPVVTTLNQCFLDGEVTVSDGAGNRTLTTGDHELNGVKWVFHHNIGYVFPTAADHVALSNKEVTGSWAIANRQKFISKEPVKENLFTLCLNHGRKVTGRTYEYVVLPAVQKEALAGRIAASPVEILSNTGSMQAVRNNELKIAYAVFYKGGKIELAKGLEVVSETPCIVMVKYDASGKPAGLWAADPTHNLRKLHLAVGGKEYSVELPSGNFSGKTVHVKL